MKKRFLSLILAVVMMMFLVVPASASEELSSGQLSDNELDSGVSDLQEEDLAISEEIAGHIAEFFIRDIIKTGESNWNDSTSIVDTTLLYDETGNSITGYTFKLTTGYIVVSAYLDLPSLILEWSDVGEPMYEMAETQSGDKVVYLGALDYYIDDGNAVLETIDGEAIPREELSNGFEEKRSIDNVDEDVLSAIIEAKEGTSLPGGITTFVNRLGEEITNPIEYAQNVYGDTWTAFNWANNWEAYKNFAKQRDFSSYKEACGPIAITNIIKMYGGKYNNTTIKNSSDTTVFNKVIAANKEKDPLYYENATWENGGGTTRDTANDFIRDSFKKYNVNVRTFGEYDVNYQNTVNALGSSNRLMFIMTVSSGRNPYGNHALVGYAYTRLMNSKGEGRAFIKVCDGKVSDARYVEIDSIIGSTYWEVNFS